MPRGGAGKGAGHPPELLVKSQWKKTRSIRCLIRRNPGDCDSYHWTVM